MKRPFRQIGLGLVITAGGLVLTAGTYIVAVFSDSDSQYWVFWGAVLWGLVTTARGLLGLPEYYRLARSPDLLDQAQVNPRVRHHLVLEAMRTAGETTRQGLFPAVQGDLAHMDPDEHLAMAFLLGLADAAPTVREAASQSLLYVARINSRRGYQLLALMAQALLQRPELGPYRHMASETILTLGNRQKYDEWRRSGNYPQIESEEEANQRRRAGLFAGIDLTQATPAIPPPLSSPSPQPPSSPSPPAQIVPISVSSPIPLRVQITPVNESQPVTLAEVRAHWPALQKVVRQRIARFLANAEPVRIADGRLTLVAAHDYYRDALNDPETRQIVEDAIRTLFGQPLTVVASSRDETRVRGHRQPPPTAISYLETPTREAHNSPAMREVREALRADLETFQRITADTEGYYASLDIWLAAHPDFHDFLIWFRSGDGELAEAEHNGDSAEIIEYYLAHFFQASRANTPAEQVWEAQPTITAQYVRECWPNITATAAAKDQTVAASLATATPLLIEHDTLLLVADNASQREYLNTFVVRAAVEDAICGVFGQSPTVRAIIRDEATAITRRQAELAMLPLVATDDRAGDDDGWADSLSGVESSAAPAMAPLADDHNWGESLFESEERDEDTRLPPLDYYNDEGTQELRQTIQADLAEGLPLFNRGDFEDKAALAAWLQYHPELKEYIDWYHSTHGKDARRDAAENSEDVLEHYLLWKWV